MQFHDRRKGRRTTQAKRWRAATSSGVVVVEHQYRSQFLYRGDRCAIWLLVRLGIGCLGAPLDRVSTFQPAGTSTSSSRKSGALRKIARDRDPLTLTADSVTPH